MQETVILHSNKISSIRADRLETDEIQMVGGSNVKHETNDMKGKGAWEASL